MQQYRQLRPDEYPRLRQVWRIINRIYLPIWIVGTIIIVLAYARVVSNDVGWIGSAIAATGTVLSVINYSIRQYLYRKMRIAG
jgi:hypothetical protein